MEYACRRKYFLLSNWVFHNKQFCLIRTFTLSLYFERTKYFLKLYFVLANFSNLNWLSPVKIRKTRKHSSRMSYTGEGAGAGGGKFMYSGRAAPGPGNSCTVRFKFSNMTGDGISLCWGPMYVSWVIVIWGPPPTPKGHTDRHTLLKTLPSRNSFRGWSKSWKHKLPTEIMCSNYSKWRKKFCCSITCTYTIRYSILFIDTATIPRTPCRMMNKFVLSQKAFLGAQFGIIST